MLKIVILLAMIEEQNVLISLLSIYGGLPHPYTEKLSDIHIWKGDRMTHFIFLSKLICLIQVFSYFLEEM